MSLDWDLTGIQDYETVCWSVDETTGAKTLNATTEALIWACMATGIGVITDKDAPVFYARIRAWERVTQAMRVEPRETETGIEMIDAPFAAADVLAHVGLRTNVFPRETDAQFAKKLMRVASEHAARDWRTAVEAATYGENVTVEAVHAE